jgi:membrane-associated phospholipid phosphatase
MYVIWILVFVSVSVFTRALPPCDLSLQIDKEIPFIPEFVWIYILSYLIPFLPLMVTNDWHRYNRLLIAVGIATLVAALSYILVPLPLARPVLGHSLSENILGFVFAADTYTGANSFPSFHVAISWFVVLGCIKQQMSRILEVAVVVLALAITFSTLFVKQHVIPDLIAGICLTFLSWIIATRLYRKFPNQEMPALQKLKLMRKKFLFIAGMIAFAVMLVGFIRLILSKV